MKIKDTTKNKKKINLALQGGGAHGAFTWGILDKFLESKLFIIEGISATSAGSINAVALAQGMMDGGEEGARKCLYDFWEAMSAYGKMFNATEKIPLDYLLEPYLKVPINFLISSSMANLLSPYQFNPININPIRDILGKIINFEKLKKQSKINLFICATNIKTGKIRIFNEEELSIEAILASTCLPKLFQAVEIDSDYYWDGGYLGNPAIFPLIYNMKSPDIIICHTVPIVRTDIPKTVTEIDSRLREISFNSSLMREMRAIAFVGKLIEEQWIKKEHKSKLKQLHMHCLRADKSLHDFPMSTVFSLDWDFFIQLRDLGRHKAEEWLKANYDLIGVKSTIDFDEWL